MAAAPIPSIVDTTDSFYQWILANVAQMNPARQFGGIIDARDWPPKELLPSVPYLAILRDVQTKTKQSFYDPLVSTTVEWRWIVLGDNIAVGTQAANRGDKYRLNVQIIQELLSAHNPGYAQKNQYSVTADVNNNPVKVVTPYDPPEQLWWTIPNFVRKQNPVTGMIYSAAQVEVTSYAPVSANLG